MENYLMVRSMYVGIEMKNIIHRLLGEENGRLMEGL